MTPDEKIKRCKVGELRPSQALSTFGVGSIVDLPNMSVMVMGLEDWHDQAATKITEERLLASVREVLGNQVEALKSPPMPPELAKGGSYEANNLIGIPVAPFPRWMVCTFCRRLAPLSSGLFKLDQAYRSDRVRYVHHNCTAKKPPTVVPARFIVACEHGHLDDFPWMEFVHSGPTQCPGGLKLNELTATGEAAGIQVSCDSCGLRRRMSEAFGAQAPFVHRCRGRHPHLRGYDPDGCKHEDGGAIFAEPLLQGASNAWFPLLMSALAIPQEGSELAQLVEDHWAVLQKVKSADQVELLVEAMPQLQDFVEYKASEVWMAIQAKQNGGGGGGQQAAPLKPPEWEVLTNPKNAVETRDFKLREVDVPKKYAAYFQRVVLAEKLREVRALVGFTRIDSPSDYENMADIPPHLRVRLSRKAPGWVPASDIRGEGIFIQFKEDVLQKWSAANGTLAATFLHAHTDWRSARGITPADEQFPGVRYLVLHSFAHALIRQLAVECGYTTASLRERIYSSGPDDQGEPMAGVLIYTAAPDSEGTLGGLVSLGEPEVLGMHLDQALDAMRLCASDPLCAEHHPTEDGVTLHGASCHACLFVPETSCERGNKYLDRSVLVPTVHQDDLAFFE